MTPKSMPYPTALRLEIRRAVELSHALARALESTGPEDEGFLWLLGRADEVRAVTGAVVREWAEEDLATAAAGERIRAYVDGLEVMLHSLFRPSRVVVRRAPPPGPKDTMVDPDETMEVELAKA
jgi:hypothetical protein